MVRWLLKPLKQRRMWDHRGQPRKALMVRWPLKPRRMWGRRHEQRKPLMVRWLLKPQQKRRMWDQRGEPRTLTERLWKPLMERLLKALVEKDDERGRHWVGARAIIYAVSSSGTYMRYLRPAAKISRAHKATR